LGVINEFLDENDIIVGAAGSLPGDLHRLWRCKGRKTYHLEYGFSCMGYEVAGSYGVKLAEPEKEVWTMISDGSYIMLHSELVSTIQERKKINIIMFDDGDYMNIDFAKNAESYGAKSYIVNSIEELKNALKDAKKSKISTLIHIKILPGTQSSGYESFWRVGIAHHSENKRVIEAQKKHDDYIEKYAKDY